MFKMLLHHIFHYKVIFTQILILFVFDRILFTESVIFKNPYLNINFDAETNIPIAPTVQSANFLQKLDHFNPTDSRTWKQVYYFEKSYYKSGGPVYLRIGCHGKANPKWLQEGYFRTNGEKNKAMFFLLEHRYYGDSQPQKDTATEHLTYLTTEQALADLASFIVSMNKEHKFPVETKWIVFGGSYAANLAAWMRLKYPHLVHGAVASSAPVLAQFNFPEYWDGVGNALASYKKECQRDIATANGRLDKMVRSANGRKQIAKLFKLCTPLSGRRTDVSYLLENMAHYFAVSVEFDRSGKDIKEACDKVLESSCHLDQLTRYATAMKMLMNKYGASCLPTNSTQFVEYMKKNDFETSAKSSRTRWYQTCTEYGHYRTIRSTNNTFSKRITLDFASGWCSKVFQSSFNKKFLSQAVDDTNQSFGGLKINAARVLFIHGTIDPWLALGVSQADKRSNFDIILIKGSSHCSDLRAGTEEDSKDLKDARSKATNVIDKWLQEK